MRSRKPRSRTIRRWSTVTTDNTTSPTVQRLGSGFWQAVVHTRGRFFRGLATDPAAAKARAESLAAGARNLSLGTKHEQ
jgi:hypothetical protein